VWPGHLRSLPALPRKNITGALNGMRRCRHSFVYYVPVLVVLAAGLVSCRTVEVQEGGPLTLTQALQDSSVDTITILGEHYSVAKELPGALPAPMQLRRWVWAHPAAQQQIMFNCWCSPWCCYYGHPVW
jgi:hypothetical protein